MIEIERKLYIRNLAAQLLLAQENLSPVFDVRDMRLPGDIYITTFQKYSELTGVPVDVLTNDGLLEDGYTIRSKKASVVLYNSRNDYFCPQRLRFSLSHEIGHILLNHQDDNAENEAEANYFASQLVAHDVIVVSVLSGVWNSDIDRIREQFGISWDTAKIKLLNINRNKNAYSLLERQLFVKYRDSYRFQKYNRNKFSIDILAL